MKRSWYGLLRQFDDANIYQTWAYGLVRNGRQNISHLVLKEQGSVVAIAQCRIAKAPLSAQVSPMLCGARCGESGTLIRNVEVFRQTIRALRNEYAHKRGLLLRLYPVLFEDDSPCFLSILRG